MLILSNPSRSAAIAGFDSTNVELRALTIISTLILPMCAFFHIFQLLNHSGMIYYWKRPKLGCSIGYYTSQSYDDEEITLS